MGLLTDPNTGQGKWTKLLINNEMRLCILVYLSGVFWFLCLANKSFNNGTYFSENALLPGLVRGEFDEDVAAKKYHSELNAEMQLNPNSIPYRRLQQQFADMSIDSFLHNFTLEYPLGEKKTFYGQNLYAILRASRSSSIEGIVVTAPFRTLDSAHPDNTASIALMLALAKFCRQQKYWAKDIVFLITDHEQLGTQAWLEAYHGIRLGNEQVLRSGDVQGRAGSIQAAVNLEFRSTKISHVDVKVEGLNGQLPNLDLVNLVHRLCSKEGIRHTFKNRSNPRKKDTSHQQWLHSLSTLMAMVFTQASCVPNGNHGLYHRFGIEAVTLEGHEPPTNYRQQVAGLYQAGRVLEGILRSLNNLLERFHQSYFFYLLPGNDRFISIGLYMPAVGLIGSPLLIKALTIWLRIYNRIKPKKFEKLKKQQMESHRHEMLDFKISFTRVGGIFLGCHVFGWLFVRSGVWLSKIGYEAVGFNPGDSIYVGYFVYFLLTVGGPWFLAASSLTLAERNFLNIIALLESTTLFLTVAMHNFSLALLLSTLFVPFVVFIGGEKNSSWKKILLSSTSFLLHPFVLIHLTIFIYTYVTMGDSELSSKAWAATRHSFVYFIVDNMIYGNWFIEAVFGFLIPNWILYWLLLRS